MEQEMFVNIWNNWRLKKLTKTSDTLKSQPQTDMVLWEFHSVYAVFSNPFRYRHACFYLKAHLLTSAVISAGTWTPLREPVCCWLETSRTWTMTP